MLVCCLAKLAAVGRKKVDDTDAEEDATADFLNLDDGDGRAPTAVADGADGGFFFDKFEEA